jgi:formylglycine-generating enzyme required for sulfatase activity
MVGNLWEWVADWVPLSTGGCVPALFAGDLNCLVGASTGAGPGALVRGGSFGGSGSFGGGTGAGVFAVIGSGTPSGSGDSIGFRAAR